jgi:putative NADPH-quinone reductase
MEMRVLILHCHPRPGSFTQALARAVSEAVRAVGLEPNLIDLYREGFDPVLNEAELERKFSFDPVVQRHTALLRESKGIAVIHPDWWGQPPALLKGWLDRVLRPGVAYDFVGPDFERKQHQGLLQGLWGLTIVTSDRPDSVDTSSHPLRTLWEDSVFEYCGIKSRQVFILGPIRESTLKTRRRWLTETGEWVRTLAKGA